MAIPDLQAHGIVQGPTWPLAPNMLAGDWPVLTDNIKAAAGVQFAAYEVFAISAAGEAIKLDQAGAAPANLARGIACQATTAAGQVFPFFKGGCFNHEELVWPAAVDTLAERRAIFNFNPILGVDRLI